MQAEFALISSLSDFRRNAFSGTTMMPILNEIVDRSLDYSHSSPRSTS